MRHYYHRISKSPFFRNILKVASGTAIGQAILLLASPILTRLYTPEAFGIVGVLMAIVVPLSTFVTGKYDFALVLPKEDGDAQKLLRFTGFLVLGLSLLTAVVCYLLRAELSRWLDMPSFGYYFWFIPLAVCFTGWLSALRNWMIRKKRFAIFSYSTPLSSLLGVLFKACAGFFSGNTLFLVLGNLLTQLVEMALFLWGLFRGRQVAQPQTLTSTRELLYRYRDFPKYRTMQHFLNTLSLNIPGILFASFYSPTALGYYWLAYRIIAAPSALIGTATQKVFFQRAAEIAGKGQSLYAELKHKTLILFLCGLPIFGALAILCPLAFGPLFGEEWQPAGVVAGWLTLWMFTSFANGPCGSAIAVIGLQKTYLGFEVGMTLSRILLVVFMGPRYDFVTLVAAFSLLGMVLNAILILSVLWHAKKNKTYRPEYSE